jgi:hypothetical protein
MKPFAVEMESELKSLGLSAFVDKHALQPGARSTEVMMQAVAAAPIGLALFEAEFFTREWPMIELRAMMANQSLLPVLLGNISHEDLKRMIKESPFADKTEIDWAEFAREVRLTLLNVIMSSQSSPFW